MLTVRLNNANNAKWSQARCQKLNIGVAALVAAISHTVPPAAQAIDAQEAQAYRERMIWMVHSDNNLEYQKALKRIMATCAYGIRTVDHALKNLKDQFTATSMSVGPWGEHLVQLMQETIGLFRGGQVGSVLALVAGEDANGLLALTANECDKVLVAQLAKEAAEMSAGAYISSTGTLWKKGRRNFSEIHNNLTLEQENPKLVYKFLEELLAEIRGAVPKTANKNSEARAKFIRKVTELIEDTDALNQEGRSSKRSKRDKKEEKLGQDSVITPIPYGKLPTFISQKLTGFMPINSNKLRIWTKLLTAMTETTNREYKALIADESRSPEETLALEYTALLFLTAWRSTIKAVCNPAKYFKSVFQRDRSVVERPWSAIRFICDYAVATLAQNLAIQPELSLLLNRCLPTGTNIASKLGAARSQDFLKSRRYAWEDRDSFSYGRGGIRSKVTGKVEEAARRNIRYNRNKFKTYFESQVDLTQSSVASSGINSADEGATFAASSVLSANETVFTRQLSGTQISDIESGYTGSGAFTVTLPTTASQGAGMSNLVNSEETLLSVSSIVDANTGSVGSLGLTA